MSITLIQETIIVKGLLVSFFSLGWWYCVLVLMASNFQLSFDNAMDYNTGVLWKIVLTSKSRSHCKIMVLYVEDLLIFQGPHFGAVFLPHSTFLFADLQGRKLFLRYMCFWIFWFSLASVLNMVCSKIYIYKAYFLSSCYIQTKINQHWLFLSQGWDG